jgi:hypothetical protein
MTNITVEQAIYGNFDGGGYRFVAQSPGFRQDWLADAQRLCTGFGERPSGVTCSAAIFAQPLDRRHMAIVQVADHGIDDTGRPGALGFHLLVLPRPAYRAFGGDPFQLADRQPAPWDARGELPALSWPAEPLPPRTVRQVQRVLQRSDGPNLLGGSQVLVDGGRLVFQRQAPDPGLLRDLWCLLPTSARAELWPATFAFGNALRFHAVAVPNAEGEEYDHYQTEEQAGDYPEGRYELALQTAAEAGDQHALDRLFARRSQAETLRLALYILLAALVVLVLAGLFNPPQPAETEKPDVAKEQSQKDAPLDLPPVDRFPALDKGDRDRLTWRLAELVESTDARLWPEQVAQQAALLIGSQGSPPSLTLPVLFQRTFLGFLSGPEALLDALDRKLGTPDPRRNPGPLRDHGPLPRRLRVLLWKQGVAAYNDPRLNVFELLERLGPLVSEQPRPK